MSDIAVLIKQLVRASEAANESMRKAYESSVAASEIAGKIARHHDVETLSEFAQEKLNASGEMAMRFNRAFAEIYGRAQ